MPAYHESERRSAVYVYRDGVPTFLSPKIDNGVLFNIYLVFSAVLD